MNIDSATTGHALRSLRLLLEAFAGSELPQWSAFAANVRLIRVEAGGRLFSSGDLHPYVYFVHHGLFKAQVELETNRLSTTFFAEEGDMLASLSAWNLNTVRAAAQRGLHPRAETLLNLDGRSLHTVIALEPSMVMQTSFRVIERLMSLHQPWARLVTTLVVIHAITQQVDAGYLRRTPEQRYRWLLHQRPDLIARVTQRDLANYLNITDAALSRIAKRVREEPNQDSADTVPILDRRELRRTIGRGVN